MEKFYLVSKGDQELRLYRDENNETGTRKYVGRLGGWRLSAVAPTVFSNMPKERLRGLRERGETTLSEEEGVRLALVMRGVCCLKDVSRAATYASGVYELSREEAFYWFARTSNSSGRRGIRALRILLGGVE
ncbi:MAG: DUF7680 family protein [Conexivisphaera sp.]